MTIQIDRIAFREGNSERVMMTLSGEKAQDFFDKYREAKGVSALNAAFDKGSLETTYYNGELILSIYI